MDNATTPGHGPHRQSRPSMIERLTQVIEVFADGPDVLLLDEVSALTGLPRSTAFRLLSQLVELQWLDHTRAGYRMGSRMLGIGRRVDGHARLREAAADALGELHAATRGLVHLAVLDGSAVVMLDKIGIPSPAMPSRVGTRYWAEETVAGRAMLAHLTPERLDQIYASERGSAPDTLHDRLRVIRSRKGLAITTEDMRGNLRGLGAAIVGPHGPVGAISIGLPGKNAPIERFAPMLGRAVARTSELYFGAP